MDRPIIYYLSIATIGLVFGLTGLWVALTEGLDASGALMFVGGTVLVVTSGIQWFRDPRTVPIRSIVLAAIGALLVLAGSVLVFR